MGGAFDDGGVETDGPNSDIWAFITPELAPAGYKAKLRFHETSVVAAIYRSDIFMLTRKFLVGDFDEQYQRYQFWVQADIDELKRRGINPEEITNDTVRITDPEQLS